jgi:hypothetical protein
MSAREDRRHRRFRPAPKGPRAKNCVTVSIGVRLLERVDAFCGASGDFPLCRSAVIRTALNRLMDGCQDNPRNLFQK